ncbi:uncharacterized protein F4822DRAFT_432274 [Hypoxylon trugodes]|uniref:uncharacterized protein n=1 Tax=Hypoxylon trugodes TaxID=326681 RepID=UPI0021A02581|nr:uncharacterized protein F4822DRAFT_432274 [Hypoxylon trugodes]KAI1385423.1 hypothetical protein F4822DRAFT_432274 [Hypoxylon trugodes]
MSDEKTSRPTPQSLPKLTIPTEPRRSDPEEITISRVDDFLGYCQKYKRAPITHLPLIPPPPATHSGSEPESAEGSKKKDGETKEDNHADPDVLDTLAFTEHESDELEIKQALLEEAKKQHEKWYAEFNVDKKSRETLQKCKHWRQIREQLTLEISMIWGRREIRRNFRRDANHIKGLENW